MGLDKKINHKVGRKTQIMMIRTESNGLDSGTNRKKNQ